MLWEADREGGSCYLGLVHLSIGILQCVTSKKSSVLHTFQRVMIILSKHLLYTWCLHTLGHRSAQKAVTLGNPDPKEN